MSRLETMVSYLQMHAPPAHAPLPPPQEGLTLVRAVRPSTAFYRWLYQEVGAPWLWIDRRRARLDDAGLRAVLDDDRVEVQVAYLDGVPAGYFELDRRQPNEIELAYFGLLPEFLGRRLGPWLLDQAIRRAWSYAPARLWVHTQTLDHPRALPLYERLGFVKYKEELLVVEVALDP